MNLTKIRQKDIMNEIVPVYVTNTNIKVVNARELYTALEVKKDFSSWAKSNLKNHKVIESVENTTNHFEGESEIDAIKITIPASQGKGRKIEYILTLDTAKELAMMSKCEKGRTIRKYFIEVEKAYNSTIEILSSNELSDEEKIAEALLLSETILDKTRNDLIKANRNKDYNKRVNVRLRKEIRILKEELQKAKNNPNVSDSEIEELKEKIDYWEEAYANLEIKLDSKESQLSTILAVKKDGRKYFNALSQKHAAAILISDADKRNMKANMFRKAEIEKNTKINYVNRFTSNFIDRIHPKSIPLALSTYLDALRKRLGSNFQDVISDELIKEINDFLHESEDTLAEV